MIGMNVIGLDDARKQLVKKVARAARSSQFKNFQHGAAVIRKAAQASIQVAPLDDPPPRKRRRRKGKKQTRKKPTVPSREGSPPHTRNRQLVRAIIFHADQHGAIIGPRHSFMGEAAAAHEHGDTFMGRDYPERPFMGPALEKNATRFAMTWTGSIGE